MILRTGDADGSAGDTGEAIGFKVPILYKNTVFLSRQRRWMALVAQGNGNELEQVVWSFAFHATRRYCVGHRRTAGTAICGADKGTRATNES
jgi:hypothetical protein